MYAIQPHLEGIIHITQTVYSPICQHKNSSFSSSAQEEVKTYMLKQVHAVDLKV